MKVSASVLDKREQTKSRELLTELACYFSAKGMLDFTDETKEGGTGCECRTRGRSPTS